jgi:hypothetical protein
MTALYPRGTSALSPLVAAQIAEQLNGAAPIISLSSSFGNNSQDAGPSLYSLISQANSLAGGITTGIAPPLIYIPPGVFKIGPNAILPLFKEGGGIIGAGSNKTFLVIDPDYNNGTLPIFGWSDATYYSNEPARGPKTVNPFRILYGPTLKGVTIEMSRNASVNQHAIALLNRCDEWWIEDVVVRYCKGTALSYGTAATISGGLNLGHGYVREGYQDEVVLWNCGDLANDFPAMYVTSQGTDDATNNNKFLGTRILYPEGEGLVIENANTTLGMRTNIYSVAAEGPSGAPAVAASLVRIGSDSLTGIVAYETFQNLLLIPTNSGYAGLRITGADAAHEPYGISVLDGYIGPGAGKGIQIDRGHNLSLIFRDIISIDTNVTVGANAGANIIVDVHGAETGLTYSIDAAATQKVRFPSRIAYASSPRNLHTGGMPARVSTDGTDTTPSITETYIAEVLIPDPVLLTGIALFNGSAVAGNIKLGLANALGAVVASTASTAAAGTDGYQRVAFSATYWAAPGTYYVLLQCSNTGMRFNSHNFGNFGASKKTGETYGTLTTVTPPTTFTADLGPIASLY